MIATVLRQLLARCLESLRDRRDRAAFERRCVRPDTPPAIDEFALHAMPGRFAFHLRRTRAPHVTEEGTRPPRKVAPGACVWPARHPGEMAQLAQQARAHRTRGTRP